MRAFVPPLALPRLRRPASGSASSRRAVSATARPSASRVPPSEFAEPSDSAATRKRKNAKPQSDTKDGSVLEVPDVDENGAPTENDPVAGDQNAEIMEPPPDAVQDEIKVAAEEPVVQGEDQREDVVEEVVGAFKSSDKKRREPAPKAEAPPAPSRPRPATADEPPMQAEGTSADVIEEVLGAGAISDKKRKTAAPKAEAQPDPVKVNAVDIVPDVVNAEKTESKPALKRPTSPAKESPREVPSAGVPPVKLEKKAAEEPSAGEKTSTSVQMSPEQIEKAAKKKAQLNKKSEKQTAEAREKREKIFRRAQIAVSLLGEKTGAINLGKRARAGLEARIDSALAADAGDASAAGTSSSADAAQQRLARTAGTAFRSLAAALAAQWESRGVPLLRERLPPEAKEVDSKALASAAIGLVAAVALLPALFSGGGAPPAQKERAMRQGLDSDTAQLQRKLQRTEKPAPPAAQESTVTTRAAQRLLEKRARTEEKIFPRTEPIPDALQSTAPAPPPRPTPAPPVPPAPTAPRAQTAQTGPAVTPAPEAVVPPRPAPTPVKPKPEPLQPAQATPAAVRAMAEKAFGARSGLIVSASFDSLAEAPTAMLELAPGFARLPVAEQRALAQAALLGVRGLGFESVTLVEAGSGLEIARAGVSVVIGDESSALRAELAATRRRAESLAVTAADAQSARDAAQARLQDERAAFAEQAAGTRSELATALAEQNALLRELRDAEREIAAVPDREAMEMRTRDAETKAADLAAAVETLSRQVVVARDAQGKAELAADAAAVAAKEAGVVRDAAVREADARVEGVRKEVGAERDAEVARVTKEMNAKVADAEKMRGEAEKMLQVAQADGEKALAAASASAEREINAVRAAAEKEAAAAKKESEEVLAKSEKTFAQKLDALKKDAQANLDAAMREADARLAAVRADTKAAVQGAEKRERDAVKEANASRDAAMKELRKVTRERESLAKQLERAKANLAKRDVVAVPVASEAGAPVGTSDASGK